MKNVYIIAAAKQVNGFGDLDPSYRIEKTICRQGFTPVELVIEPLSAGWDTPLAENHFRSGCAPIEALGRAKEIIASGQASAVVISGKDSLKTGYDRAERHRLMAIYGQDYPLTEAYTDLARTFMKLQGLLLDEFLDLAKMLFENYARTSHHVGHYNPPAPRWYQPVTNLFRGVDCANPVVDFDGRLLLCNDIIADACSIPMAERVTVLGVGVKSLSGDGPSHIGEIAAFQHLKTAFQKACDQAGINFSSRFLSGEALLEVYTCYPVVPLAFLLASGLAASAAEIPALLKSHEITVTGGMNLARAPWNNPSLNALIVMFHRLRQGPQWLGAVHGNGGLGYRQGVAILGRSAHSKHKPDESITNKEKT